MAPNLVLPPPSCARCGKPILEPRRRTYCSEGCADVVAHQKRLVRLSKGTMRPAKFRFYPKESA